MGQGKSKPPTRVVVTDDTVITDNIEAEDEDVTNSNVDTVSIYSQLHVLNVLVG